VKPSTRLARVPEFPFARWGDACREAIEAGADLIRLDVGNPDLPPPPEVIDAARSALGDASAHGYPGYRCVAPLRRAIADYYDRRFSVSLDPESEICCLLGSKEGIVHLTEALVDPGDVVLVPDPGYAPYAAAARLAGAEVIRFPLLAEHGHTPDFDAIDVDVAKRARILWLNYPNNPTGAVGGSDVFAEAVAFARAHDMLLCHDAPYADVRFDGEPPGSLLASPGARSVAIEFNSLSKTYNMAGWRIGYAVGALAVLELLRRIRTNVDSGMFMPIQRAAVTALATDATWIERRNTVYRERLAVLVELMDELGFRASMPSATHYVWVGLPEGESSEAYARRLLRETGVAVAPGTFFGPGGEGFLRISATAPTDRIHEAARRWSVWVGSR